MSDTESLSDTELVDLLQRYLTILEGHPSAEEMMERIARASSTSDT